MTKLNKQRHNVGPKTVRTTVSIARVLWDLAQVEMARGGYNGNFSSYVADLIRHHREEKNRSRPDNSTAPHQNHVNQKHP